MELNEYWDTPEEIRGMVIALKKLGLSDRAAS